MTPEPNTVLASYDERTSRRHLVVSERVRRRRRELGLLRAVGMSRLAET